jgi:hypothetical protein
MRYWAYLAAKLLLASAILKGVWEAMNSLLPEPQTFLYHRVGRFGQDLPWTLFILGFWLFSVGLIYLIAWDQRRRCRTCLRRLRMPVEKGHWGLATLLSPVRSESICPYGHGTLAEPEVKTTSTQTVEWRTHEDIWRELETLDRRK